MLEQLLAHLFSSIIKILAEGSSQIYALMVLKKYINDEIKNYPFLQYIDLDTISASPDTIQIDKSIDKTNPAVIADFILKLMKTLFTDQLKAQFVRTLSPELSNALQKMGVKLA